MTDPQASDSLDGELISRLRVIEAQPLDERAVAYTALHDRLSHALETGHTDTAGPDA